MRWRKETRATDNNQSFIETSMEEQVTCSQYALSASVRWDCLPLWR